LGLLERLFLPSDGLRGEKIRFFVVIGPVYRTNLYWFLQISARLPFAGYPFIYDAPFTEA